ncbi:MAG: SpoIIE family protein phosphatase [Chthoniobacterales bacterium]
MSEDVSSLKKSLSIYKGLVEVSSLINSITEFDKLLRAILNIAKQVMQSEVASLFLVDASGNLELIIASSHEDVFIEPRITVPKGRGIAGWVQEHGESALIPDAYKDPRFYAAADKNTGFHTRSVLCTPLFRGKDVIGVLQVLNPMSKDAFEKEDLDGFVAYSNLISTAIEKIRAIERLVAQERVERDLSIAAEIQRELLSRSLPENLEHAEFAAYNQAAQNVGGDFYDVFQKNSDTIYFAIGDVSGKGISASLLMAQTLSALQFVFRSAASPAEALEQLNNTLHGKIVRGMFVTVMIGRFTPSKNHLEIASAGHCQPILASENGEAKMLEVASGMPLGILSESAYAQTEISLEHGDYLVLYTDGLSESRPAQSEEYLGDHLIEKTKGRWKSSQEIVDTLVTEEKTHRQGGPQRDDLTILVGGHRKIVRQKRMKFTSDPDQLGDIRLMVRNFIEETGIPEMERELIILAVDEACTNVIRHAYESQPGLPIDLEMTEDSNRLIIRLRDRGKSCDPKTIRSRGLEEIRPGGVGVHIIKKAFDTVEYIPHTKGMELLLIKKIV